MKFTIHIFYLIFVVFTFLNISMAQAPDTLWAKSIDINKYECAYEVKQTSDHGFIIVAETLEPYTGTYQKVLLIKTDADGDTMWTKIYGGTWPQFGYSLDTTSDGGCVITGHIGYPLGPNWDQIFLLKTDQNGDSLWQKEYGGTDLDYSFSVRQTSDNGYIIAGSEGSGNTTNFLLIKTDSSGNLSWSSEYGGVVSESANSVQQTSDNGYILTGYTYSFGSGSNPDLYLVKTDSLGDTLWTKVYGGDEYDYGKYVSQTLDNGYIVIGTTESFGLEAQNIWLLRTDANGDTIWTKTFGDSNASDAQSGQQTADGGYIIGGSTNRYPYSTKFWLIKTDENGDTLWTKYMRDYNSRSEINSIQQLSDEGYIATGYQGTMNATDIMLIRFGYTSSTGISGEKIIIDNYKLQQNYPNPFNPSTTISYSLPYAGVVNIKIYDVLGKKIKTLIDEFQSYGDHTIQFNASNLASGIYFYRLEVGNEIIATKKMLLIR